MEIRDARPQDAPAACQVLRRSITELCIADHRNDPAILQKWLANKTPGIVRSWIENPSNTMLVAAEGAVILAVGSVTGAGEITTNYVSPNARFQGISRAMMAELEARTRRRGLTHCTLVSTETARSLLPSARLHRNRPGAAKIRHRRKLPDDQKPDPRLKSTCRTSGRRLPLPRPARRDLRQHLLHQPLVCASMSASPSAIGRRMNFEAPASM